MQKKQDLALKAVFSAANMNGTAAILMSFSMGTWFGTGLYAGAVLLGAFNKYRGLKNEAEGKSLPPENHALRALRDPRVTAAILMGAAVYNFGWATHNTFMGPADKQIANALCMAGWVFGFFGDNAVRRLDGTNFKKDGSMGAHGKSKLRETFHALTANPTVFYNGASVAFTIATLTASRTPLLSGLPGPAALAALSLIGVGLAYAVRNTWRATKGEIETAQINDGVMNYCSSLAKAIQTYVAAAAGNPYLAAAQAIFTCSNIKVIYETRAALAKKPPVAAPGVSFANQA